MRAAKKVNVDSKVLQELVPLNALSEERFRELSGKIVVEEVLSGRYLFRKGDRDGHSIYVLEGKVNLIDGFRKVISEVESGTDISRYPIANQQPRPLSARAVKKVVIARVDSSLLDVYLTWDQSQAAEAVEIGSDSNEDWMTRLLQSEAFIKIPPSMIQSLLIKMEKVEVSAGDTVVQQGEKGDYFYTVSHGRCAVTHHEGLGSEDRLLAELGEGDSFGEEALVSEAQRNATVTMLTDGVLMRLAKQDFVDLLKNQLVKHVEHERAIRMVDEGAVWVDVRTEDEYRGGAYEDSVNIPLSRLRDELSELVFNSKYIICCDTGRRSESAGFLLGHKGFDVYVLEGGMPGSASTSGALASSDVDDIDTGVTAEVVQLPGDGSVAGDTAADQQNDAAATAEVEALRSRCEALLDENNDYRSAEARLNEQLDQLRAELGESSEKLDILYKQAKQDAEQMELLRSELGESGEKLGEFYARESDVASESRALQSRCMELQDELATQAAAHDRVVTELQSRMDEVEASAEMARTENEALAQQAGTAQQTSETAADQHQQQLQQLSGQIEGLNEALKQAGESQQQLQVELEARANQVTELESGNTALSEQVTSLQTRLEANTHALQDAERQAEGQAASAASVENMQQEIEQLQADLKQADAVARQLDAANEQIDRLTQTASEAEQRLADSEACLETEKSGRAELQQQLSEACSRNAAFESELETVKDALDSQSSDSSEQYSELQQQLAVATDHTNELEQQLLEKDVQLTALQEQLGQQGGNQESLQQERELLKQQLEDAKLQLGQQEEWARTLETEKKESEQKAHNDLTRKNDNEKELRTQIDRLRKKLEQQTVDYQKTREGNQSDVDHLRDQLNTERQERAEERSEMAARQRELKEQLANIATEHEANMSNHNGAIEKARDAARLEEQERLHELLDAQSETEDQIAQLQKELKAAHRELAELAQQEKDRRQIDMELMEEQNQQAVSTITQLETQLKQLTDDRDAALEEQQSLRSKFNTLRGEVEVARGLMGVEGQVEDPAQLHTQLKESKKNVEIALRLRAEAERERDRLLKEKAVLLDQMGARPSSDKPLHVPSLDNQVTAKPVASKPPQAGLLPALPQSSKTPDDTMTRSGMASEKPRRYWLAAALGSGVVTLCAVAVWLYLGTDKPVNLAESGDVAAPPAQLVSDVNESVASQADTQEMVMPPAAPVEKNTPEQEALLPAIIDTPLTAIEHESDVVEWQAELPDVLQQATPVMAAATFRDGMKGGAKGPLMIALPAGSYQMGSVGNSLNFDEGPRHEVSVPAFSISQHEVTFREYDRFARATGRRLPYDETWGRGDRPVINVSWHDAQAYTAWLSRQTGKTYRLPSEAEWEYAARAGSDSSYWWQDDDYQLRANCFNCGSDWDGARTAPTGSFEPNAFGLVDVAGNVQEWTADCYHGSYQGAPVDGSAWVFSTCEMRVVRGGAYSSPLDSLRSAKRSQYNQDARLDNLGFRVVRSN